MKTQATTTRAAQSAIIFAALTITILAFAEPQLFTLAESSFDDPAQPYDGWVGTNNNFRAERGLGYVFSTNTGGYISLSESNGDGATMFFAAPPKFLGDKRAAYNGILQFTIRQFSTRVAPGGSDVLLRSTNGLVFGFHLTQRPSAEWRTYDVPLNETAGWTNKTSGQTIAAEEFANALASLQALWIRAEYSGQQSDASDLDSVALLGRSSGAVQPTLAIHKAGIVALSGAIGHSYRLEYSAQLGTSNAWMTLTNIVLPESPLLIPDTTFGVAPTRFYRAVWQP